MKNKFDYTDEIIRVSNEINKYKNCFKFVAVADSHLDNSVPTTLENIKKVDEKVNFSCMLHLGDFLNGNIPSEYTKQILKDQIYKFRKAVSSQQLYITQGNHDGFCDNYSFRSHNISLDEEWNDMISYIGKYDGAKMVLNKPYYYIDIEEEKLRFISLCPFSYCINENDGKYEKYEYIDDEQLVWLENEALNVNETWNVIIFSHDTPFALSFTSENVIYNEKGEKLFSLVKRALNNNGFTLLGWFAGHQHGDFIGKVEGINFIYVGSNTAYVPSLWAMAGGGTYAKRELNTVTEDLWDTVIIDKENRKLKLIRFGAGNDREIDF